MRKVIWCSTILGILSAAGVFFAARHAVQTPDSFLGRWVAPLVGRSEIKATPVAAGTARRCSTQAVPECPEPARPTLDPPEITEPIVVEPSAPPEVLALPPALAPEIADAIERIRAAEESDGRLPMAFVNDQLVRMPLADEEELPCPRSGAGIDLTIDLDLHQGLGLFFFPPSCWKNTVDLVLEIFKDGATDSAATSTTPNTNEEAAEEGAAPADSKEDETTEPELLRRIHDHRYHQNHCPYHGGCPSPYHYRTAPAPVVPVNEVEMEELPAPRRITTPDTSATNILRWFFGVLASDQTERLEELLNVSDEGGQIRGEWKTYWKSQQPYHLTPTPRVLINDEGEQIYLGQIPPIPR